MKTPHDPRHQKREHLIQDLFAWGFGRKEPALGETKEIVQNLSQIDTEITQAAPERPLAQINRVDLSILRLSVFELIIKKDAPFRVVVDEAVELAKEYGSESSPSFINGVLGKVIENNKIN